MRIEDALLNARDQDRGRPLEIADPFEGRPIGVTMWIAGPDSETAHRARLRLGDDLAAAADIDGRVSAEAREKARRLCLAAHVLRWEATEEGKPVPFSTAAVLRLIGIRWIEEQVDAFAGDRRNFAPEA